MKITKESWFAHPSFRHELADLLAHPTFQIALSLVEKAGLKPTPFLPNIDLRDYFALMGAKRDGFFEALTNLDDLSKPQVARPPEKPPWTTPRPGADADRTSAP